MPRSQPDTSMLLRMVVEHLDQDLYPTLEGAVRYRLRVAINVLRIVEREIRLGPALDAEEHAGLRALLASSTEPADTLRDTLARQIGHGDHALDDPQLTAFLRRNLERTLRINNPRWIGAASAPQTDTPQESP